jgi:subtilase family serine protease
MQRNLVRNLFFVVLSLLLIATSLLAIRVVVRANQNQRAILSGQAVPLIQQAHLMQTTDPNQQLNLSIGLQLRNPADLDSLLSAIYNPQSPQYHQYLTPDQFNQLFAPTPDQVQQVVSFLQGQGLTVTSIAPNNLLIDATGSVAQVQQAFNVQINNYQVGNQTFYANATSPSVPASISPLITSIGGLDNSVQYHPLYRKLATHHQNHRVTLAGQSGFGPKDLSTAYDATPLQSAGILGDNQAVALFELDGYQASDTSQYFQANGLATPNITNVMVDNFNGSPGQGAIEVELDIEVAGGIAPHANQIVYEGPNTTQGVNDTYNQIVHDNKAQIVSISWGLCEASSGGAELQTLDNIFKQGASQGISFFAASGDSGSYDCGDGNLAVDSPADDPYVTGVGGTNLQLNAGAYGSESVWSNPNDTQRSPQGAGGGGGISNTFTQPSWQTGSGVSNQYSNGNREVPDVSADADPATGYSMYCTVTNAGCPANGWLTVGGTSASAPLWAGSMALINQYLRSQGKAAVGYSNPALYGLFNAQQQSPAFHDVNTGNNLYYPATNGYDMASGIGTPDVNNIAHDLALISGGGTPTPTPTSTPTSTPTTTPTLTPTGVPSPTPTSAPDPTPTSTPTPLPTPTNPPSPTPTSTPTPPPPLIQNGGFEKGQAPWQESSSGGYQMVDSSNAHNGLYSAYLCGYVGCDDRIWQTFTVPTSYTKITVTYWWYSDTNKITNKCFDYFNSSLKTSASATNSIRTLQNDCNTKVTNNWVQQTFDVTPDLSTYKGKQVTLFFRGTNVSNQYQPTDFFVDDVVVNVQ